MELILWERGDQSTGPRACPLCGSIGTGLYMGQHLLREHRRELRGNVDLTMAAIESELMAWTQSNVIGTLPAGEPSALEAVRKLAESYGWEGTVRFDPDDDRKIILEPKGLHPDADY
jgi:hypothetical protein